MEASPAPGALDVLGSLWREACLPERALAHADLPVEPAILASSFRVNVAAQASIGAAGLAAATLHALRTGREQSVRVTGPAAERECTGYFRLDGTTPDAWAKLSGLYETRDGHVRVHANFDHHRDGVLRLLGLPDADRTERDDLAAALRGWDAQAFEDAAADAGLAVSALRSFEEWDAHPHAIATAREPLVRIRRIGDAAAASLSAAGDDPRPLTGVRVLDLTRILAGPICGRTLAAHGADVLLVNSPRLPNIAAIVDTSRGKRSAHVDLETGAGLDALRSLLRDCHVFVQGYRPGALEARGFGPEALATLRPGIVTVSLSAYGSRGPWASRRGFDSLVQTATGFNHAEAAAAGADGPRPLPVQILDYASGFLMAFGAQAALLRQLQEGGSWAVEVSLLQTANWLRSLGRVDDGFAVPRLHLKSHLATFPCAAGVLEGLPHAAELSATPARWRLPSVAPGTDAPVWSAA